MTKRNYKYNFKTTSGEKYALSGWNTMKFLHHWLNDLSCVNSPQGNIVNFEELVKLNVDLVILRVGDCTVRAGNIKNRKNNHYRVFGLNLAVIYTPNLLYDAKI